MPDLGCVTHVVVERAAPGGYHYLHESSPAWLGDTLTICWANHRTHEVNTTGELVRCRDSRDGGLTWETARTCAEPPQNGSDSYNHPVILSHAGRLWGFFTRWDDGTPSTEGFVRDADSGAWHSTGMRIPGFIPFRPPARLPDGTWIMSGEHHWHEAAVALCSKDDFSEWKMVEIPRPESIELLFPEATLMEQEDRLVAIMRPRNMSCAPVSISEDWGRSWSVMQPSNFPMAWSQPYCGKLSAGQYYLISNDREADRALLSIAVTDPGETLFRHVWKIRHQCYPVRRLFGGWGEGSQVGNPTEWSYPGAVEHDGNLYVSCTQGKEDCVLSVIPISALAGA
jgi:hypothetical protein